MRTGSVTTRSRTIHDAFDKVELETGRYSIAYGLLQVMAGDNKCRPYTPEYLRMCFTWDPGHYHLMKALAYLIREGLVRYHGYDEYMSAV